VHIHYQSADPACEHKKSRVEFIKPKLEQILYTELKQRLYTEL